VRAHRDLAQAIAIALAGLACGPVGIAMAAAPTVASITPESGTTAGGTLVTIKGSGFVTGATVTIGGVEATEVFVVPETEITAKTPAAPAGTDDVVVSDINGTSSGGPSYTYVAPPPCAADPVIETQPKAQAVTAPAAASFEAKGSTPADCAAPSVQWSSKAPGALSFTPILGAESATYTTPATSTTESGTKFEATFTNAFGSSTTEEVTLTVEPPPCAADPVIETQPKAQAVTAPAAASFEAKGSTPADCAAPSVQWSSKAPGALSFTPILGAESATYTTPATSTTESGTKFEATFTNAFGSSTTEEVTLTVEPPPCAADPVIETQPANQTVTAPATATFKVAGSTPLNCAAPTVQWSSEAPGETSFSPIGGATSTSYTTPATTTAQSGTKYEAIFKNASGETTTNEVTLTVEPPPPTVTSITPSSGPTAGGTSVKIKGKGFLAGSTVTIGSAASEVEFVSEEEITAKTPPGSGTQEVVVTDAGGTSTPGPFYSYIPPPTVTLKQPLSPSNNTTPSFTGNASDATPVIVKIYAGATVKGTVVSKAEATRTSGSWSSGKANPALKDGQYTATATQAGSPGNPAGVSPPVTFTVDTVAPAVTITTPASGKTLSVSRPTFSGAAGDATGDQPVVTLNIYVGASVSGTLTQTLQITPAGTKWTTGSTGPRLPDGTYTAQVQQVDGAGNVGTASVTFAIKTNSPAVTLNTGGLVVRGSEFATGATPSFTGSAGTAPEDSRTVTLRIYGGTATATASLVRTVEVTLSGSVWTTGPLAALPEGIYTAQAEQTDSNPYQQTGVSTSATFTVDASPPLLTLTGPADGTSTVGESQSVTGTAGTAPGDLPAVTVQLFSGSAIGDGQTPLQSILVNTVGGTWSVTFAGLSPGNYAVRAEQSDDVGNLGVSATTTFALAGSEPGPSIVPAHAPPAASFSWFPTSPHTGETVSLLSSSTDATSPITGFAWNLAGNGVFAALGQATSTSFSTPGSHLVQLRVTDANGLSSVASEAIEVSAPVPELMQPFPIVQISATRGSSGVKLKLLSVQAPAGARITVACTGHGCPVKSQSRVAAAGKVGAAPLAFRRFERSLRAGVILEIRVSKPGEIGKYTRFAVRRGRLPLRVDTCLAPTGVKPMACPSS